MKSSRSFLGIFLGLAVVLSAVVASAHAPTMNEPTAVAMSGFTTTAEFTKICHILQSEAWRWSIETQRRPECLVGDRLGQEATLGDAGILVQAINEPATNTFKITIENIHPADPNDPKILSWRVLKVDKTEEMLRKLMRNYTTFDSNKEIYKQNWMSNYLGYRVNDEDFKSAYSAYVHDPENARYVAAELEIAGVLGAAMISYYSAAPSLNSNARDWDYHSIKQSFDNKITLNALRFDDNHYNTNQGHYGAGFGYDTFARASGASRAQALLFTFAGSSFWETVGEYREVISIVDETNTTFAGFVLGETIFQLSKIFRATNEDDPAHQILKYIFGFPERMSAWIEYKTTGTKRSFSDVELTDAEKSFWSNLQFDAGVQNVNGHNANMVGIHGEVINLPYYDAAGKVSKQYLSDDTIQAKLDVQYGSGDGISKLMRLYSKIVLSAIYQKNLQLDENQRLNGYQMFIGPSMALEINDTYIGSQNRDGQSDFMGIVHVLGETADITVYSHGLKMHTVLDVYADFAMMHSPSFDSATDGRYIGIPYVQGNCSGIQSVLCHEGYYYGYGPSVRLQETVQKGNFTIGGSGEVIDQNMINGRSRFFETAKWISADDVVQILKGFVAYQFTDRISLELGIEHDVHRSAISSTVVPKGDAKITDVVKYGQLVWKFE